MTNVDVDVINSARLSNFLSVGVVLDTDIFEDDMIA